MPLPHRWGLPVGRHDEYAATSDFDAGGSVVYQQCFAIDHRAAKYIHALNHRALE
jgi:hypothetical protein